MACVLWRVVMGRGTRLEGAKAIASALPSEGLLTVSLSWPLSIQLRAFLHTCVGPEVGAGRAVIFLPMSCTCCVEQGPKDAEVHVTTPDGAVDIQHLGLQDDLVNQGPDAWLQGSWDDRMIQPTLELFSRQFFFPAGPRPASTGV